MLPDSQIFESKLDVQKAVFDYIETFYNCTGKHSSQGQISPLQFLQLYNQKQNIHLKLPQKLSEIAGQYQRSLYELHKTNPVLIFSNEWSSQGLSNLLSFVWLCLS